MNRQRWFKKKLNARRITGLAMLCLALILLITSIVGFILRSSKSTLDNLYELRTDAVVHQATQGLIDEIARQARADRLKELRADKNAFRSMGENRKVELLDEAEAQARLEAEALYGDPVVIDRNPLNNAIENLESILADYSTGRDKEKSVFATVYVDLVDNVESWTEIIDSSADNDDVIFEKLCETERALSDSEFAHMKASFVSLARTKADEEKKKQDTKLYQLMTTKPGEGIFAGQVS